MWKITLWFTGIVAVLVLVTLLVAAVIDEPVRAYLERELNARVGDYEFRIGKLDLHPLRLGVELNDVWMRLKTDPETPLAHVRRMHGRLSWPHLLRAELVVEQRIEGPTLRATRSQLSQLLEAREGPSWQEIVLALPPFTLRALTILDGDVAYLENAGEPALRVNGLTIDARNIRNARTAAREYPSTFRVEAQPFGKGSVVVSGQMDLLADPHPAAHFDLDVKALSLADFKDLLRQYDVHVADGVTSTTCHIEFSPVLKFIDVKHLAMDHVKMDYLQTAEGHGERGAAAERAADVVEQSTNRPGVVVKVRQAVIEKSDIGFVNKAANPPYRIFLEGSDLYIENLSNHLSEGTAVVRLRGMFMGTGPMTVTGSFRPEDPMPDFDVDVQIDKAKLTSLNKMLRAYAKFDVTDGYFSFFSELRVKNGEVEGYVKPLFKDVKVYDRRQDRHKGVMQQAYEGVVGGIAGLLSNRPRDEVATKTEISGSVTEPHMNTWQAVRHLIENAFFRAILPGLERHIAR